MFRRTHFCRSRDFYLKLLILITGLAAVSAVFVFYLTGCTRHEPILIGFAGNITGPQSDLGVQSLNGVELAVKNINEADGINGRPLELIIRDDKGTIEGALAADRELIDAGVVAIIGHATSTQTKAVLPLINSKRTVLVAPISGGLSVNTEGGYYFRVISTIQMMAYGLAKAAYEKPGPKRIAVIYDTDNPVATQTFLRIFTDEYTALGGKVGGTVTYSSRKKPDFTPLLEKLQNENPNGLLIIANSFDTVLIAQRTRIMGWNVQLFGTGFAQVTPVMRLGGTAVNGMEFVEHYNLNSKSPAFLEFKKQYEKAYSQEPAAMAPLSYEAVQVLAAALRKTNGQKNGLRDTLLKTKNFKGLADTFSFDKYGGAVRPVYVVRIVDGKRMPIGTVEPPQHEVRQ